jgi:hypothetical protein
MQNKERQTENPHKLRNKVFRICRERARRECTEATDMKGKEISL